MVLDALSRIAARRCLIAALALGLVSSVSVAHSQIKKPTASGFFGDDKHTSTIDPFPAIPISTIASPGNSDWFKTSMDKFKKDNPTTGKGPSHLGWDYHFASAADQAKVEAGIKVIQYYPYVITPPAVSTVHGLYKQGDPGELGGAVFYAEYTAQKDAPTIKNLRWIQVYQGTAYGNPFGPILDNDPANPYVAQSAVSPFYDANGFSGIKFNGGYFLDRPLVPEKEYEKNPVATATFQVFLVDDDDTGSINGVKQHDITVFGGEEWGFTYSATDVPEPSAFAACLIGGSGVLLFWRMRGKNRAV